MTFHEFMKTRANDPDIQALVRQAEDARAIDEYNDQTPEEYPDEVFEEE